MILLVTSDASKVEALTAAFRGLDEASPINVAESALFALTQLERDPPDLIVYAGNAGMSGAEFLEILRADVLLKEVALILLDETALTQVTPGAHEIVLESCASPAVVLGAATSLLARSDRVADAVQQPSVAAHRQGSYLQGTTGPISPFDLLSLLARGRTTGHLTFDLGLRAVLWFSQGRLVDAEYGQLTGVQALTETLRAVQAEENVGFDYRPGSAAEPRITLTEPLEALLLSVALELDRSS